MTWLYTIAGLLVTIAVLLLALGWVVDWFSGEDDQLVFFAQKNMARSVALLLLLAALLWLVQRVFA